MGRITDSKAAPVRMYTPGRTIHTVRQGESLTLCKRSLSGLHPLPTDGWSRMSAEASTNGECMRCLKITLSERSN